jgi:hypothetical protein
MIHQEIAKELVDSYTELLKNNIIEGEKLQTLAAECSIITANELISTTRAKLWYNVRHELLKIK